MGVLLLRLLLITDEVPVSVGLSCLRSSGPLRINLMKKKQRIQNSNLYEGDKLTFICVKLWKSCFEDLCAHLATDLDVTTEPINPEINASEQAPKTFIKQNKCSVCNFK